MDAHPVRTLAVDLADVGQCRDHPVHPVVEVPPALTALRLTGFARGAMPASSSAPRWRGACARLLRVRGVVSVFGGAHGSLVPFLGQPRCDRPGDDACHVRAVPDLVVQRPVRGGLAVAGEVAVQVDDVGMVQGVVGGEVRVVLRDPGVDDRHTMSSPKALNERRTASALTVTQEASTCSCTGKSGHMP